MNEDASLGFLAGYIWYATSHDLWNTSMNTDIRSEAEAAYEEYVEHLNGDY